MNFSSVKYLFMLLLWSILTASSFSSGATESANALVALGYDIEVAQKLIRSRPDLVHQILNFNSDAQLKIQSLERTNRNFEKVKFYGEKLSGVVENVRNLSAPVRLYRGLRNPPSKFDSKKFDIDNGDIAYFSEDIKIALNNALVDDLLPDAKFEEFTVIEIQVPRFLVYDGWPTVCGRECPILFRYDIKDFAPFISKIGSGNKKFGRSSYTGSGYSEEFLNSIAWKPFDKHFKITRALGFIHSLCSKLLYVRPLTSTADKRTK